ncbi:MAG: hypothetical protein Q8R18_01945 [bacterium]|nr:hypothetical protein [bacterium]
MIQKQNTASKKGQASLYIILGMVFVILVILYYVETSTGILSGIVTGLSKTVSESLEQSEMREQVNRCLSDYAKQGLELLQTQGGYIELPREQIFFDERALGIFSEEGIQKVSISSMEEELSQYVQENVERDCFNDKEKYSLEQGDLVVTTTLKEEEVVIEAEWLLQFHNKEDPTLYFSLQSFAVALDTNMLQLFEEAELVAEEGMDYHTQYYAENTINRVQILNSEANITILSMEEEYFIIAIKK